MNYLDKPIGKLVRKDYVVNKEQKNTDYLYTRDLDIYFFKSPNRKPVKLGLSEEVIQISSGSDFSLLLSSILFNILLIIIRNWKDFLFVSTSCWR